VPGSPIWTSKREKKADKCGLLGATPNLLRLRRGGLRPVGRNQPCQLLWLDVVEVVLQVPQGLI
jgi:hypothetical protein